MKKLPVAAGRSSRHGCTHAHHLPLPLLPLLPTTTAYYLLALLLLSCGAPQLPRTPEQDLADSVTAAFRADSIRQASFADSLSDGYHAYRDGQGRLLMEGRLRSRLREGIWTSYQADGAVMSRSEYANGELHGITTVFHGNGALYYTGQYLRGKPAGEWRFHDPAGQLAKTVTYDTTGAIINSP